MMRQSLRGHFDIETLNGIKNDGIKMETKMATTIEEVVDTSSVAVDKVNYWQLTQRWRPHLCDKTSS